MEEISEIIRHYSKVGVSYSLSTDEADEATLQRLGYVLMQSEYPGPPFMAAADGTWVIDSEQAFSLLRAERNRRLTESDFLVLPGYPLSTEDRDAVLQYRTYLRDLPAQDGAPWDGGGENTPWPKKPKAVK